MKLPVYLEKVKGDGYRASTLAHDRFSADGATREEALERLRRLVAEHMERGELLDLEIGEGPDPWLGFAGVWKDDPHIDDFVEAMREYRRQVDADPDRL
jgi:predicted RNase H-like HicB family nuclease